MIAMTEFFLVSKSRCKAHLILWIYMVYPNIQTSLRHIFQIQWSDSEYNEDNSNFLHKTFKSNFPLHLWQDFFFQKKRTIQIITYNFIVMIFISSHFQIIFKLSFGKELIDSSGYIPTETAQQKIILVSNISML